MKKYLTDRNVAIGASLLFLAALLHRNSTLFFRPQFWAEDFKIYFLDDFFLKEKVLFEPYNGFVQLACRLIAYVAGLAPLSWIPWIYSYSFILAIVAVGTLCYFSSAFKSYGRAAAPIAWIVAPVSSEVYLGMAFLHFTIGVVIALALYEYRPRTTLHKRGLIAAYAAVSFSSPFGIVAIPFAAWKAYKERTRYALTLLLVSLGSMAMNLPHLVGRVAETSHGATIYRARALFSIFYGWAIGPVSHPFYWQALVGVATFAALSLYLFRNKGTSVRALVYFVGFAFVLFFVSLGNTTIMPDGTYMPSQYGSSARYYVIPVVLILWTLISIESQCGNWKRVAAIPIISAALYFAYVERGNASLRDMRWPSVVTCLNAGESVCPVEISPSYIGTLFVPSVGRLEKTKDHQIFRARIRQVSIPRGTPAGFIPLVSGTKLTQKLRINAQKIYSLRLPVATGGKEPSAYTIEWAIYLGGDRTRQVVTSGTWLASDFSDWQTISLPVFAAPDGQLEIEVSVPNTRSIAAPLLLPLFQVVDSATLFPVHTDQGIVNAALGISLSVIEP